VGPVGRLDRLLDELLKSNRSDEQILEALYLATLARLPSDGETKALLQHVSRPDRREGFKNALWALINTKEFGDRLKEWGALNPGNVGDFLRKLNEQGP
jgi:hypothetical protein